MSAEVTLVWIGAGAPPPWRAGRTVKAEATPASVAACVAGELPGSTAEAWLFWSSDLGSPDPERVLHALATPGDLWHAGLRLGTAGLPRAIDHVEPTWMLNRDPDPSIVSTSWRLSLDACLVRTDVLRRIGNIHPEFRTLAGAALEFGHRCVRFGVLTRHMGSLAGEKASRPAPAIPIEDELRFVYYRFGRRWLHWTVFRTLVLGWAPRGAVLAASKGITRRPPPPEPRPYRQALEDASEGVSADRAANVTGSVTILIPTVDRYPYLEKLLDQLRRQTVPPLEIVIVDQTPPDRRRSDLASRFPDLPIQLLQLDRAGQCSSRNAGIAASRGEFLLFLDDDDEVPPGLIEKHLAALERFRNDVSCGVADEDGAGPLPAAFRLTRASDVFPTNNSMIRMSALEGSGLFDLAYDRGARADADLGMRLYLAGNLMVLNSDIHVLHRHAPSGGLRTHGARVITYASSRGRLSHRHLLTATEIYKARRYYSPRQVEEMYWHAALGTFSARGGRLRRLVKAGMALLLLPHSLWATRQRARVADGMLREYPRIPAYEGGHRAATAS